MPRKSMKRKQTTRRGNDQGGRIITEKGRMLLRTLFPVSGSSLSYVNLLNLLPSFSYQQTTGGTTTLWGDGKVYALSLLFQLFRFTKLRYRIIPSATAVDTVLPAGSWEVGAGFSPAAATSAVALPVNLGNLMNLPYVSEIVVLNADGGTVPSVPKWFEIPKRQLLGDQPLKWWRTVPTAGIPSTDIVPNYEQGVICFASQCSPVATSSFTSFDVDIEYTVQFSVFAPINPGITRTHVCTFLPVPKPIEDRVVTDHSRDQSIRCTANAAALTAQRSLITNSVDPDDEKTPTEVWDELDGCDMTESQLAALGRRLLKLGFTKAPQSGV